MLSHGWFSPCFLLDGLTFLYSILFSPLTWKSYIQLWGNVVLKIVGSEANCLSSSTAPPVLGYGTGTRVHLAMCICGPLLASYKVAIFASWVLAIMPMMFPCSCLGGYLPWPLWQPHGVTAVVNSSTAAGMASWMAAQASQGSLS